MAVGAAHLEGDVTPKVSGGGSGIEPFAEVGRGAGDGEGGERPEAEEEDEGGARSGDGSRHGESGEDEEGEVERVGGGHRQGALESVRGDGWRGQQGDDKNRDQQGREQDGTYSRHHAQQFAGRQIRATDTHGQCEAQRTLLFL